MNERESACGSAEALNRQAESSGAVTQLLRALLQQASDSQALLEAAVRAQAAAASAIAEPLHQDRP
jgi:hypothetical protein